MVDDFHLLRAESTRAMVIEVVEMSTHVHARAAK
jgi:hypothetical protein